MGRTGRVETILGPVLDELGLRPADSIAYICGNPDMILAAEADAPRARLPRGPDPQGAVLAEGQGAARDGRRRSGDARSMPPRRTPTSDGAPRVYPTAPNTRPTTRGHSSREPVAPGGVQRRRASRSWSRCSIIEVHLPALVGSGSQAMLDSPRRDQRRSSVSVHGQLRDGRHLLGEPPSTSSVASPIPTGSSCGRTTCCSLWLTVVPFTTAVVGDHPTEPVAVFIYGVNLALAAAVVSSLMGWYVFFKGDLGPGRRSPMAERRREWRKGDQGRAGLLRSCADRTCRATDRGRDVPAPAARVGRADAARRRRTTTRP